MKRFKKIILLVIVGLILAGPLQNAVPIFNTPTAQAEEVAAADPAKTTPTSARYDFKAFTEDVGKAFTWINLLFNPLIHFFTFHIGQFLSNDLITDGTMGDMLKSIWVVCRNLVNIIFVLILLVSAFKQILGVGEESLKNQLPKFAILLIAVNFSWLAGKVILDASNVAANVMFSIPSAVNINTDWKCDLGSDGKPSGQCMPTQIYYVEGSTDVVNIPEKDGEMTISQKKIVPVLDGQTDKPKIDPKTGEIITSEVDLSENEQQLRNNGCPIKEQIIAAKSDTNNALHGKSVLCWKKMDLTKYTQNNASMMLTFGIAKLQDLTKASLSDNNPDLVKISISGIFTILIQLAYIVAFGVLFILLIARVVVLWIFMAFSPLIVLFMIGHDVGLTFGGVEEKITLGSFVNWAMAPAKLGAVFSIGFLMVFAGQRIYGKAMGADKTIEFNLNDPSGVTGTYIPDSLFANMDNMYQFIWLLMVTVIIWMGTWAVLHGYETINNALHGFKESVEEVAKLGLKAPFIAPIFPGQKSVYDYTPGGFLNKQLRPKFNEWLGVHTNIDTAKNIKGRLNVSVAQNINTALTGSGKIIPILTGPLGIDDKEITGAKSGKLADMIAARAGEIGTPIDATTLKGRIDAEIAEGKKSETKKD